MGYYTRKMGDFARDMKKLRQVAEESGETHRECGFDLHFLSLGGEILIHSNLLLFKIQKVFFSEE